MADPPMHGEGSLGGRFTRVWTASTISDRGDGVLVVAFPLLAASLTRDPLRALAGGLLASWLGLRAPMLAGGLVLALTAAAVTPLVNTDSTRAA